MAAAEPLGFADETAAQFLARAMYAPSSLQHEGEPEGLRGSRCSCRVIHPHEVRHGNAGPLEVPFLHELVLHMHPLIIASHS